MGIYAYMGICINFGYFGPFLPYIDLFWPYKINPQVIPVQDVVIIPPYDPFLAISWPILLQKNNEICIFLIFFGFEMDQRPQKSPKPDPSLRQIFNHKSISEQKKNIFFWHIFRKSIMTPCSTLHFWEAAE